MLGKGCAVGKGRGMSDVRIWPWMAMESVLYAEVALMRRKREPQGPGYLLMTKIRDETCSGYVIGKVGS